MALAPAASAAGAPSSSRSTDGLEARPRACRRLRRGRNRPHISHGPSRFPPEGGLLMKRSGRYAGDPAAGVGGRPLRARAPGHSPKTSKFAGHASDTGFVLLWAWSLTY